MENHICRIPRFVFQLAVMVVAPALAWPQLAIVHVSNCGPQNFPGSTCTIPATGTGNLIVVGFQSDRSNGTGVTVSAITDDAGNTYAEAGASRAIDSATGTMIDFWYAKKSLAGATSITITPSSPVTASGAVIWEVSGADTSAPLDQTSALNSQNATLTPAGAAVTTTSANEVILSMAGAGQSLNGILAGNAFTSDSTLFFTGWAHLVTSSAGTYSPQWAESAAGTYASNTVSFKATNKVSSKAAAAIRVGPKGAVSACDLNADGVVNVVDVQLATNMNLGLAPCTANIDGLGVCNQIVINQVINAAIGGSCVTAGSHSVSLNWVASTSGNLAGYNVYRAISSGGYDVPLNPLPVTAIGYTDTTVVAGQTYFYVVRTVDNDGNLSTNSNEATAVVPFP